MIYWCLCILALKVVKSFDDGGLRLTDKSWTPSKPPPPPTHHYHHHHHHLLQMLPISPSYLVMSSSVISIVTHCYFISSLPRKFKLEAEEEIVVASRSLSLPLSPFRSFSVWMHSCIQVSFS